MKTLNDELNLINEPALENKVIDTVELSKILLPEATSYKLTDLTAYLKFKFDQSKAHRAIIDAEITTELFLFLKEKFVNLPIDSLLHLKNLSQDRKSTHMNSSHVSISYAVFCLIKKT